MAETKPVVTMDVSDLTWSGRVKHSEFNPTQVSEDTFNKIQETLREIHTIPNDYVIEGEVSKIEREQVYVGYKIPELVSWKVTIALGEFGYINYQVLERFALPEIGKKVTVELPSYLRR